MPRPLGTIGEGDGRPGAGRRAPQPPAPTGGADVTGPIDLGPAPPETVVPPVPETQQARLAEAQAVPPERRRDAVADVVRSFPAWPAAWAALGDLARDDLEAYAAYRVGYHRGLDELRRSGWRGSGYVRWSASGNRGFLRCLHGLSHAAAAIGESAEHDRCELFLRQLDPGWPPAELAGRR